MGRPPVAAGPPGPADERWAAAVLAGAAAGVRAGRPPEAAAPPAGVRTGRPPEPAAAPAGVRAEHPPGTAAAAEPDVPTGPPTTKRRRLVLAGAGVAVAAVAATLLWTLDSTDADGRQDGAAFGPAAPARPSVAGDTPRGSAPSGSVRNPPSGAGGEVTAGTGGVVVPGADAPVASAATEATTGVPGGGTAPGTVRPGGTEPTTEAPATGDPPSGGRTLSSTAGSVVAECTDGKALLTSWTPNDPYRVERVNAGPDLAATAVFRHKSTRIRMTVTCVAGVPSAVVLPL
jgi:serine/threonine-protein kinase